MIKNIIKSATEMSEILAKKLSFHSFKFLEFGLKGKNTTKIN